MIIEKSADFGETWEVLQYYGRNCSLFYGMGAVLEVTRADPTAVTCSIVRETPYQNGEVLFPVREDRYMLYTGPNNDNFAALYQAFDQIPEINRFLQFTDIRIHLLRPATDGNARLQNPETYLKYYYAIGEIDIIAG